MLLKLKLVAMLLIASSIFIFTNTASAHCDSYDGPVIKDAEKALEANNVNLVLKWVSKEQEKGIPHCFKRHTNYEMEIRKFTEIVKKHFFETLVRLHRETEGAPYTGLKVCGNYKTDY